MPVRALAFVVAAALAATFAPARAACPPDGGLTPITAVQGSGPRSPLVGRTVRVEGVVTAAFPGPNALDGFFLQDRGGDGDASTSDALFVRLRGAAKDTPAPGEIVRVAGTVLEFQGMTEIGSPAAPERCGRAALPAARTLGLPLPKARGWEALEGMLVHIDQPLTITDVYQLPRYGELTLAAQRLFAPTQGASPTTASAATIVLDDGSALRDPQPTPFVGSRGSPPRVGDRVTGLTAVVMEEPVGYQLEPVSQPTIVAANPRPTAPPAVGGDLTVASFNVHNLFTTLGDRGASSAAARALQRQRLATAVAAMGADVIALQEVENDGERTTQALVDAVNGRLGSAVYAAAPDPPSGVGSDRIKQAILYRSGRLRLLATASDPRPIFERAPVAATFRWNEGTVLTVIAVHLKSKGGCPVAGDVDRGSGCWNLRRSAQAQAVVDFAERLQRSSGSPNVLVAGDLNSYAGEAPVTVFRKAGFRDADALVPANERYSYVYRGGSGTLDYVLASPSLAGRWTGAAFWHIDADEPPLSTASVGADDVFRVSDHDPVLVGFR